MKLIDVSLSNPTLELTDVYIESGENMLTGPEGL